MKKQVFCGWFYLLFEFFANFSFLKNVHMKPSEYSSMWCIIWILIKSILYLLDEANKNEF